MIFEGYENYITERTIDLTQYKNENEFYENFFQGDQWEEFSISNAIPQMINYLFQKEENNQLIDQLQDERVTHILLIIPLEIINHFRKEKRKNIKEKTPTPRVYTQDFIKKLSKHFTTNNISCSIFASSRHKDNIDLLEQWLNFRELKKLLKDKEKDNLQPKDNKPTDNKPTDNKAYIFGFKDIKIDNKSSKNAISLEVDNKQLTIKEDCSALLGSSRLFKFNTTTPESIVKVTNNGNDKYIDFITENIELITSSSHDLRDEYLDDEVFEDFGLNTKELQQDDVEISFDKTSIVFSSHIPTPKVEKTEESKPTPKIRKEEEPPLATATTIGTDTDDNKERSTSINLKNDYLVTLNRFVSPYEHGLVEVHYHLVKNGNRLILVGGSRSDKTEQALAKVVAHLSNKQLTITNLSNQAMTFNINDEKAIYQLKRATPKVIQNTIDTDEPQQVTEEPSLISLNQGESHSFNQRIEFPNTAIEFSDNGVEVEYINFVIGSFNNKLEFNRHYFRHFGVGNIIDNQENFDYAGRIYEDGTKNILGSTISRNLMLLTLRRDSFTLSNQIKESYTIFTQTATKESEISYQEEESFSKDELLSKTNHLSIAKDGIVLVELSIQAN